MLAAADLVGFLPPQWIDFRGKWRILAKVTVLDENHRMVAEGPLDFTEGDQPALTPDLEPFAAAVQNRIEWYLNNESRPGRALLAQLRQARLRSWPALRLVNRRGYAVVGLAPGTRLVIAHGIAVALAERSQVVVADLVATRRRRTGSEQRCEKKKAHGHVTGGHDIVRGMRTGFQKRACRCKRRPSERWPTSCIGSECGNEIDGMP
jgi:hypothetical protein